MKILKGCLTVILIFIILLTTGIVVFNRNNSKQVLVDNVKPKKSLIDYEKKISERNILIRKSNLPDSVKILSRKSDSLLKNYKKLKDILWNEYRINQNIYHNKSFETINNELNETYIQYNSDAKDFNFKWLTFPFNTALSANNLRSYDLMYSIDYGKDNSANMEKRKKAEHWIETGEVLE